MNTNLKRSLLFFLPVLLAAAILAYFINQKPSPETVPRREQARHVRVIEVAETELVPRVSGFGVVEPAKQWTATAQVSGEIIYVHPDLKKGAILQSGTEIIRISPADFDLAIAQTEANIRATEAKIRELAVSRENTRLVIEIEKRTLEIRERELARHRDLLKKGTVSRATFDKETRDTFSQRKKVQDLENALRLIPTQLTVQTEQKAVYEAQLQSAKLDLARTRIPLPFDARISQVNVEIAQFAQAGQTLAMADGIETAEVEAQVPIERFRDLIRAAAGDKLTKGFDALSLRTVAERLRIEVIVRLRTGDEMTQWPARFARISDTIDPKTRTIGIIAAVDGAYSQAIPGERPPLAKGFFVEVEVRARALGKHLIVPRSALHDDKLYIADADNRLEIRSVEVGLRQGNIVSIDKGLKAGERVIVSDVTPAIAGMLLKTIPDHGLSKAIALEARAAGPLK